MRVPDGATIFHNRSDEGKVGCLPYGLIQVASITVAYSLYTIVCSCVRSYYTASTLEMRSHFRRRRSSAGSRRPACDRIIPFYSESTREAIAYSEVGFSVVSVCSWVCRITLRDKCNSPTKYFKRPYITKMRETITCQ